MLPKRRRLGAAEVRLVLSKGRSIRGVFVSVKALQNGNSFKTAAVVPKSVAKKAVARNKLRRAIYRALLKQEKQGFFVVFMHTSPPTSGLAQALSGDLDALFSKVR